MTDFMTFMSAPLAACVLLSLIYTYFGIHVLKREIIFVDLSLAQLAALGTTAAYVLELDLDSPLSLFLSMAFIIAGGAFFTGTRALAHRVPQEAVIGIVYVVGASLALLLASRSAHGAEHIKNLLNGSILWMSWTGVVQLLGVILLVSGLHWVFQDRFLKQSLSYKSPEVGTPTGRRWDFLFYVTLGLVIVFSVKTAGIFLIFALLIIPAVCGALFSSSLSNQFFIGAAVGISVSFGGLILSYWLDLPTGATLVCSFGVVFLLALFFRRFQKPASS